MEGEVATKSHAFKAKIFVGVVLSVQAGAQGVSMMKRGRDVNAETTCYSYPLAVT